MTVRGYKDEFTGNRTKIAAYIDDPDFAWLVKKAAKNSNSVSGEIREAIKLYRKSA